MFVTLRIREWEYTDSIIRRQGLYTYHNMVTKGLRRGRFEYLGWPSRVSIATPKQGFLSSTLLPPSCWLRGGSCCTSPCVGIGTRWTLLRRRSWTWRSGYWQRRNLSRWSPSSRGTSRWRLIWCKAWFQSVHRHSVNFLPYLYLKIFGLSLHH